MEKIPTAEEFLKDLQHEYEETGEYKMYFAIDIPNKLKEFAKLHVEKVKNLQQAKYYAGETGYIKKDEWEELLTNIK